MAIKSAILRLLRRKRATRVEARRRLTSKRQPAPPAASRTRRARTNRPAQRTTKLPVLRRRRRAQREPSPAQVVLPVKAPASSTPDGAVSRLTEASPARPSTKEPIASETSFVIPSGYGEDRIVAMVKDPWWLFAYWEIQSSTERAARNQLHPGEIAGHQSILRVYDVTDVRGDLKPAHRMFDIILSGLASNWYIHVNAPGRSFVIEIGLLTPQGRFIPLARSNRVTTPRSGPSEVIDEQWMTTDEDFWRLVGSSGVAEGGSSASRASQWLACELRASRR